MVKLVKSPNPIKLESGKDCVQPSGVSVNPSEDTSTESLFTQEDEVVEILPLPAEKKKKLEEIRAYYSHNGVGGLSPTEVRRLSNARPEFDPDKPINNSYFHKEVPD